MKKQISKEFIFHTEQNRKRVRFQPSSLLTVKFDDTLWQSLTKLNFGGKASENIGGKNKEECKLREELFYNAGNRHLLLGKRIWCDGNAVQSMRRIKSSIFLY